MQERGCVFSNATGTVLQILIELIHVSFHGASTKPRPGLLSGVVLIHPRTFAVGVYGLRRRAYGTGTPRLVCAATRSSVDRLHGSSPFASASVLQRPCKFSNQVSKNMLAEGCPEQFRQRHRLMPVGKSPIDNTQLTHTKVMIVPGWHFGGWLVPLRLAC